MPAAGGSAQTRFGISGWGERRAGSFAGKELFVEFATWFVVPGVRIIGIARIVTLAWTSSEDGDVEFELDGLCGRPLLSGTLHRVEVRPSETQAPTDNWDLTLEDFWGVDVLGGLGMNQSDTDSGAFCPYLSLGTSGYSERGTGGELTLKISGAGVCRSGVVRIVTLGG